MGTRLRRGGTVRDLVSARRNRQIVLARRPVGAVSRRRASMSPSATCPRSATARRCSKCATSASTPRSAAGSTSAATTCRASRSASACARTASAWSSRPTTPRSIRSGARSCTSRAGSSTASCSRTRSRRSRWCPKASSSPTCSARSATSASPRTSACSRSRSPQPGETFLVSAAASGVGSIAGQIAKMQGARVIGIAGSAEKCAWVVDELGFDACIDYKTEDVAARLKELAPKGVDVFFDNVGGELLDTVLRRLALRARVVLCGDISTYDVDAPPPPLHNVRYLMGKRARMEGFNTLDHWDHYERGGGAARRVARRGQAAHARARARRPRPRARSARPPLQGRPPRQARRPRQPLTSDASRPTRRVGHGRIGVAEFRARARPRGGARSRGRAPAGGIAPARRVGGRARPGDPDAECRARPGRGLHLGAAAVRLGDRGDDREAEPGAAARSRSRRVGAPEPFERARRVFGRHARAVVAATSMSASSPATPTRTSTGVVGGVCVRAFSSRLATHLAQAVLVAGHDDRAGRL